MQDKKLRQEGQIAKHLSVLRIFPFPFPFSLILGSNNGFSWIGANFALRLRRPLSTRDSSVQSGCLQKSLLYLII